MYFQIGLWGYDNSFFLFTANQKSDICDKVDHSEKLNWKKNGIENLVVHQQFFESN